MNQHSEVKSAAIPQPKGVELVEQLVAEHEAWRARCINLCAAETRQSPAVRRWLDGDLAQRYGNFGGRDRSNRRYHGTTYVAALEEELVSTVQRLFGVSEVELRAISGHVAGLAVIMGTCKPGDTVVELSGPDGGHRLAAKAAESPLIDLRVLALPFDPLAFNVDLPATCEMIARERPRLVIVGASNFLFPIPLEPLARCIAEVSPGTVLAYDASHVLGLIACGVFQKPLEEGAHLFFGSTHKTLPGPQGALILSNRADIVEPIATAIYPGIVTNHHLARIPALITALNEVEANSGYGPAIIRNARALALRLVERGLPVAGAAGGYTASHTVLVPTSAIGSGRAVADRLQEADIIVTYTSLPAALGTEGIRLGTAEATRLGATEEDMRDAADLVADLLIDGVDTATVRTRAHAWSARHQELAFASLPLHGRER